MSKKVYVKSSDGYVPVGYISNKLTAGTGISIEKGSEEDVVSLDEEKVKEIADSQGFAKESELRGHGIGYYDYDSKCRIVGRSTGGLKYYLLTTTEVDNDNSSGEIVISGNFGGWWSDDKNDMKITIYTRSFSVFFEGIIRTGHDRSDIVVYDLGNGRKNIYLKVNNFASWDFEIKLSQVINEAKIVYDGNNPTSSPEGTLLGYAKDIADNGWYLDLVNGENLVHYCGKTAIDSETIKNYYSKSETDNLLEKNVPIFGNRQAYGYYGEGKYRYCLVAKLKIQQTWQNVDLCFEYGGNGSPTNVAVVKFNVNNSLTSDYSFNIYSFADTSYKFLIKDMGNGEANVYCDMNSGEGFVYITRVWGRALLLHKVTMAMEGVSSVPDGTIPSETYLWAKTADKAETFNSEKIGHPCEFDGTLSSTKLLYSPKANTIGGLPVKEANEPNATKSITGSRDVRFGNHVVSIDFERNAFMDYFFDYGYHFDNESEASTTFQDIGMVCYMEVVWLCEFKYNSNSNETSFSFKKLATLVQSTNDDGDTIYTFEADKLINNGDTINVYGNDIAFQHKSGTVAMKDDIPKIPTIPSVVNSLDSYSTSNALSANQGRELNSKISAIKFSSGSAVENYYIGTIGSNSTSLVSSISLYGGDYGTFYVIYGQEEKQYGMLSVKTSNGSSGDEDSLVANASGENGFWGQQWLSLSVFVPAGKKYYLYGRRMVKVHYSYSKLSH